MKIIFCFNQISYVLAKELANNSFSLIFIDPRRVEIDNSSSFFCVYYRPSLAFFVLLFGCVFRSIEVVLPHNKSGFFSVYIERYVRNFSYIDDGLDTFRNTPKNISLLSLRINSRYYTFRYNLPVAEWLSALSVIEVCGFYKVLNDIKPAFDLSLYDCVVIESPGVSFNNLHGNVFVFRHPNLNKMKSDIPSFASVSGGVCSVEKSLIDYGGTVRVGESMLLIFLLYCKKAGMVELYFSKEAYFNLSCLHSEFLDCRNVFIDS